MFAAGLAANVGLRQRREIEPALARAVAPPLVDEPERMLALAQFAANVWRLAVHASAYVRVFGRDKRVGLWSRRGIQHTYSEYQPYCVRPKRLGP